MKALRKVEGIVAPLDRPDVDTDQIIPKNYLKRIERTGYGQFLFDDWRRNALVTLHNFADTRKKVTLKLDGPESRVLIDVFADRHSKADASGTHEITLAPYGWKWFRVGMADSAINRAFRAAYERQLRKLDELGTQA